MAQAKMRPWREAATLILTARQPPKNAVHFDYRVLMLKRSSRSKFMPNAFVFPGGVLAKEDLHPSWQKLLPDPLKPPPEGPRPFLMQPVEEEEGLPRHIAFRIAAIRETFEESGVLLLQPDDSGRAPLLEAKETAEWRLKVQNDPGQMLELCRYLGAAPDLDALSEWSDWLTPVNLQGTQAKKGTRRFDTIFYTAQLDSIPSALQDQTEVTAVRWEEPSALLSDCRDHSIWLAPPQVYEVSRLLHFREQKQLKEFAQNRERQGLTTLLPVRLQCSDGELSLYPGDSMYPQEPDYVGESVSSDLARYPGTIEECRAEAKHLNRQEFSDGADLEARYTSKGDVMATCAPEHGHINPMTWEQWLQRDVL